MSETKDRRKARKKQQRINTQLKKRLYKNVFMAPCCYCKNVFFITELTIEHVIPRCQGGTNDDNNIALACAPCNQEKGREAWFLKKDRLRIKNENYQQHTTQHQREDR